MADTRCKRRKQSNPRRKNVDLENMPEDSENHSGMRSPSPPTSRSRSPHRLLIANGDSKEAFECRITSKSSRGEEEEKIQEYLKRSDTAVIYAEPVATSKDPGSVSASQAPSTTKTSRETEKSNLVANDEYLLKCPHCERIFSGQDAIRGLTEHLGEAHKEVPITTPKRMVSAKNSHPCTKCSATFVDKESLSKHKLFHTANGQGAAAGTSNDLSALRKFKCPECGKAFKFKHHLKEHIRIHSGEKPFACQNCGKRFSHSGSYSSHMTSKKCLVVNLKVRKVDARSPRGRGSANSNPFRPIIPKYASHTAAAGPNELSLVPAGFGSSSERFSTFLSPNRPPQPYLPITFHPLLTSTPPYMPVSSFSEVTQLLQHRLENDASLIKEERGHSQSQSQVLLTSPEERCEEPSSSDFQSSHTELNAVKKILEIVDATVKQQNQQTQQPAEKTRNGLLSELLKSAPQTLPIGELQPHDSRCKFCCKIFDNKIDIHQHERYLCPLNSDLQHSTKIEEIKQENASDCDSSKESNEEKRSAFISSLNSENLLTLKAHYETNPRPKKSEMIRLSRDMKCPARTVQAWFHCQQRNSRDHMNGDSPHSPTVQSLPPSPFNSVIPHYNGTLSNSATSALAYSVPDFESTQGIHSNYNNQDAINDQPLDLSVRTKKDDPNVSQSPMVPVESEALNLSQKSSRISTPPKEPSPYRLYRPPIAQIHDYSSGESSPLPNLKSSLLYKYMQLGFSSSVRSPQHECSSFNPPLAAVTPTSPEKSPTHAEGPRTLPSPDAASSVDNCCSPSGTMESYLHMEENNDGDVLSPSSAKKLRIWNQQGEDESTLDDSPEPEEDSSGGSGKMRKSWKIHKVESEEGLYACDQCDKMFSKQSSLARHKYEHSGQRPHKCDVCNKAFKHKHHLTEHKRLHSGEKPFQCKKCLKRFSHSGSYSQHMNHRYSYCKPYHE